MPSFYRTHWLLAVCLVLSSGGVVAQEYPTRLIRIIVAQAPYKGSTPAWIDLISGQIVLMFTSTQGIAPHFAAGKLRLLATCGERRATAFPEAPTWVELGYPGLVMTGWTGLEHSQ